MTYSYLRLSTDEANQSTSFDVQREAIGNYMKEHDLILAEEYADTVSGTASIDKRPSMAAMFNALKKGDMVIVHKRDRLARDGMLAGWIQFELKRMSVDLIFIDKTTDASNPADVLMEQMLFAFAEYEREMIVSRIRASKKLQKSRGEYLGGSIPYGFDVVERDGIKYLSEIAEEQEAISIMVELRRDGFTYAAIGGELMRKGIHTRSNNPFAASQIKRAINAASV